MEIYTEITRKWQTILDDGVGMTLPDGVTMNRRKNSKACYFEYTNDEVKKELVDFLEERGFAWQDNN